MAEIRDLCFVDIESTGLHPHEGHEIIEVAMVRICPKTLEERGRLHEYILPHVPPSSDVATINGYNEEEWRQNGAQHLTVNHLKSMSKLMTGATLAGQNPGFDKSFLEPVFKTFLEQPWPKMDYHLLDVASLAWPLFVSGHIQGVGLKHTRKLFGLTGREHRALSDVLDTITVYKNTVSLYTNATIYMDPEGIRKQFAK